ncbi:hypothetical protein [Methanomethylophilus alvi]|uniref:hypothetical protein n=1 Tax=Methanomethylophilus alvi TaxID=1291540 RepID=UPI0037DC94C2
MSEMNRRDERRAEKTVEKQLRRSSKEQERTLRRQKAENADDRSAIRERYRKKSAARMEKKSMFRTMIVSTVIIFCAFLFFEFLLFIVSGDGGDLNTHLLNLADNSLAFVIGLTAMDAVMYVSQLQSRRRGESRAIIRHNRIVQPAIDMYLARKNMLITPPEREVRTFQIVSDFKIRDLKDMYGPSDIVTDAGRTKIETFRIQTKSLHKAMLNMVEDIDFDFNPEICDAAMRFINATTYGTAALDSLIAFGEEGMRSKRMTLIKQMKEEEDGGSLGDARAEMKNVYLVQQMIQEQEAAIKEYLTTINEMSDENSKNAAYDHYE